MAAQSLTGNQSMNPRKCNTLRKYIAKSSSKWEILVLSDIVVSSTTMKNVEIGRRKRGEHWSWLAKTCSLRRESGALRWKMSKWEDSNVKSLIFHSKHLHSPTLWKLALLEALLEATCVEMDASDERCELAPPSYHAQLFAPPSSSICATFTS